MGVPAGGGAAWKVRCSPCVAVTGKLDKDRGAGQAWRGAGLHTEEGLASVPAGRAPRGVPCTPGSPSRVSSDCRCTVLLGGGLVCSFWRPQSCEGPGPGLWFKHLRGPGAGLDRICDLSQARY